MGLLTRKIKKDVDVKEDVVVKDTKQAKNTSNDEKDSLISKVDAIYAQVIIKPLVTEKAAAAQSINKYSFIVNRKSDKTQIKRAIKEIYGIMPASVNIMNVEGKATRSGKLKGRRSDYKKAIVTMPKGKSISIHEGV